MVTLKRQTNVHLNTKGSGSEVMWAVTSPCVLRKQQHQRKRFRDEQRCQRLSPWWPLALTLGTWDLAVFGPRTSAPGPGPGPTGSEVLVEDVWFAVIGQWGSWGEGADPKGEAPPNTCTHRWTLSSPVKSEPLMKHMLKVDQNQSN